MKQNSARLSSRMQRFLKEQRLCCKNSTIQAYNTALGQFSAFLMGKSNAKKLYKKHIAKLTPLISEQYLQFLHNKKLVPHTMVNYFLVIRKYLAWEIEQGAIKAQVIDRFDRSRLPKIPEYLPKPLSQETDILLINRLRNSTSIYAPIFLLLRLTGLRISELINLQRECIVTSAKGDAYLKVPLGKMNNERLVPLNLEAIKLVSTIKNARYAKHSSNNLRLIGINGQVSSIYHHLNLQFRKITRDLKDQNKPVTFHRLRHTYATTLLTGGVSIVSIMKLLGHKRIEMSLRYAQVTPTHLRDEYLKALDVLENQWLPKNEYQKPTASSPLHPNTIIDHLKAFIHKAASLDPRRKKNILLKLSRLQQTINNIRFAQKSEPNLPP